MNSVYVSRSYVEWGPFTGQELVAFHNRGILNGDDYVREQGSATWLPIGDWIVTTALAIPVSAPAPAQAPKAKTKSATIPKAASAAKPAAARKVVKKAARPTG